MPQTLLILGASARAAACSARRAGLSVVCGDLYADADLQACFPTTRVEAYPAQLLSVAVAANADAWLYAGGLENHPRLVERIGRFAPLWGNGAGVLRLARDPQRVHEAVVAAGLPCPEFRLQSDDLPTDGSWLRKPLRSAGGVGVRPWRGATPDGVQSRSKRQFRAGCWFQRRMPGLPCAALYVAAAGDARLLGLTEQLLGDGLPTAEPEESTVDDFRYAGSLGPLPVAPSVVSSLARLGQALAAAFGLVGLFGVDGVLHEDTFWPVEVNPRYTASVEVIERATDLTALSLHQAACLHGTLPQPRGPTPGTAWCGKYIVYAPRDIRMPASLAARMLAESTTIAWPAVADIPPAGSSIAAGHPVLTVLAEADSRIEVVRAIRRLASDILTELLS